MEYEVGTGRRYWRDTVPVPVFQKKRKRKKKRTKRTKKIPRFDIPTVDSRMD